MSCATALITATLPSADLAAQAVSAALATAGMRRAQSVLLLLTEPCLPFVEQALKKAAAAAGTLSISGCVAPGLLTEQDWVLDAPAAVALVLDGDFPLLPGVPHSPCLTLAAPNALAGPWLNGAPARYGAVAGDATGQGPYCLWHQSRLAETGRIEFQPGPRPPAILTLSGYHALSAPVPIAMASGHDVLSLGRDAAATHLKQHAGDLPLHELAAGLLKPEGQMHWARLVGSNSQTVTIADQPRLNTLLQWGRRDTAQDVEQMAIWLAKYPEPAFALLFLPANRMQLDTGEEPFLACIRQHWPTTPVLGFYGNGQFTPEPGLSPLLDQGLVLAAFGQHR